MSFLLKETSLDEGNPIELYQFNTPNGSFFYTTAESIFTYGGVEYIPTTMKRGRIGQSPEGVRNDIKIQTTLTNQVAYQFKVGLPRTSITIKVTRVHRDDPLQEGVVIFEGIVLSAKENGFHAEITCRPLIGQTKETMNRLTFQRPCNHTIYDPYCGLDREANSTLFTIDSVDATGFILTVPGLSTTYTDGDLIGGIIATQGGQLTMIATHTGNTISILELVSGVVATAQVNIAPGCQQQPDRCKAFGNYGNYFGFVDVPNVDLHNTYGVRSEV